MSLQSRIATLITAIGADIKELQNRPRNKQIILHMPAQPASAAATNLASNTFSALNDNNRTVVDLRGCTKVRIVGKISSLVAATKIRVQYHTGGDPAVASADGGWTELATTAGSHSNNVPFYSSEISVPAGAQIETCVIRAGLYSGDGAADPTLGGCVLNFYN